MLFFQQKVQRLSSPGARRCRPGRQFRRFHPQSEQLEDRRLLATVNWIGGSGDWNTIDHWDDGLINRLPGPDDDAVIDVAAAINVSHSAGAHIVKSLTVKEALTLSGGSLTVAAASRLEGDFTFSGGGLVVNGPLTLAGMSTWTAGTITGASTVTNSGTLTDSVAGTATIGSVFSNTGTLAVQSGTLSLLGTVSQVSGTTLTGGTWIVANGATLDLASAPNLTTNQGRVILDGATSAFPKFNSLTTNTGNLNVLNGYIFSATGNFTNSGALTVGNGQLRMNFLQLTNQSGGLIDLENDTSLGLPGAVINAGTFQKSGGAGTITVRPFTNLGGSIDVRSGTLVVDGRPVGGQGATWTGGNFQVAQGAMLDWTGEDNFASYELTGTFAGSGDGTVRFGSGRLRFGAAGGTFNFAPELFQWSGFSEIDGGATHLANLGAITIVGDGERRLSHALNNSGTIIHGGTAALVTYNSDVLTNLPGGTYDIVADVTVAPNVLNNLGTLRKSGGTGIVTMARRFNNQGGTIDVQSGTIQIGAPSSGSNQGVHSGGNFSVATGAFLNLTAAGINVTYTGTYTGSGLGTVRVDSGGLIVGAAGATFNFPAGMFQWTGGAINGGASGLNNVGTMTLAGSNLKNLYGVLNNAGTISHTGTGNWQLDSSTLNNLPDCPVLGCNRNW